VHYCAKAIAFSATYHSPSLAPGNTPYVRNEADLSAFLQRIEQYLRFFTEDVGGRAATPFEVKTLAEGRRTPVCVKAAAAAKPAVHRHNHLGR
jgi:hypothetical protein